MSSFFNSIANDFSKFEKEVLGPDYKYYRFISKRIFLRDNSGSFTKDKVINYF